MHDVLRIAELRACFFQLAMSFDVDIERSIDQDVGDRFILEQRFERTESNHIVGQFGGERCFLDLVEPGFFFGRNCGDEERDFCPQSLPWHVVGHDRIDALHQDRAHLFL